MTCWMNNTVKGLEEARDDAFSGIEKMADEFGPLTLKNEDKDTTQREVQDDWNWGSFTPQGTQAVGGSND